MVKIFIIFIKACKLLISNPISHVFKNTPLRSEYSALAHKNVLSNEHFLTINHILSYNPCGNNCYNASPLNDSDGSHAR